jgi:glutamate racemase
VPPQPLKIGVFDSGVGGLTVLRELARNIPHASYLYFGDTARLPYGSKSAATVARYAIEAAHFLQQRGAEMLVIACNTATALALPQIRAAVRVPVEGVVEPGAEAAAAATQRNRVVVIATEATVASHAYKSALEKRGIHVCEKACPLFVPLIEEGWVDHAVTQRVAHIYLDDFFYDYETGPDVLVLGCTHYPLIKSILRSVCPWRVEIVDSAECTARAVARSLNCPAGKLPDSEPDITYFATDSVERFARLGQLFMGRSLAKVELVKLEH